MVSRVAGHDENPITRPRVYLIDSEVAIQFPEKSPETERVSVGLPFGGSFSTEPEKYGRRHAPVRFWNRLLSL